MAGLPNITGSSGGAFKSNSSSDKSSGCFRMIEYDNNGSYDSNFNGCSGITFSASISSSIYGSSDTVTPLSVSCRFYVKY